MIPVPGLEEFLETRSATGIAFSRQPVRTWVKTTLSRGETLHMAAAEIPGNRPMHGRGTVYLIDVEGIKCVVRRYLRGGGMRFLGDRYVRGGESRPKREAVASDEANRRGIRTPPVLAWAVYPSGLFYRADLVTEFMPESNTLAELLFENAAAGEDRRELLESAGGLIARMAAVGVFHADMNARNVLLQHSDARYEAAALDLDRMLVNKTEKSIDPTPMLARLERSIRKLERGSPFRLTEPEWQSLRSGAGLPGGGA